MKQPPFTLSQEMRAVVAEAIRDHAEVRCWSLITSNVRSNHVHVILRPPTTHDADAVMAQLKFWGTRRLIGAGLATSETRVWVDHGSTRYLDTEESLRRAVEYVRNQGPE
jgi:REP element-mobilizing transposase RayT